MKKLIDSARNAVKEQNKLRFWLGLPPIKIEVRKCMFCGQPFESIGGNRFCDCRLKRAKEKRLVGKLPRTISLQGYDCI